MNIRLVPSETGGSVRAVASKSVAHRMLVCAAFAKSETRIVCADLNGDILATARCLEALGAKISIQKQCITVSPVAALQKNAVLPCGESGSTLRFLLPVCALLGACASFSMSGRLPMRPLSPLREVLESCGAELSEAGSDPLTVRGRAEANEFSIKGDVSSQFISGLMLGLAVSGGQGKINIIGELQSAPYVDITADVIRAFGGNVKQTENSYLIDCREGLFSERELSVEGDFSGAAFPLCLGALGRGAVTVTGLDRSSRQGDRYIVDILKKMGASVEWQGDSVTVFPAELHGIEVDARQIPDLVPVVATLCALAEGESRIYNAERLRLKESDRLSAVEQTLTSLGAKVRETEDGLAIVGVPVLRGGVVSSFGDHRIVMSAAVASVRCEAEVVIKGADAVSKSYPVFFEHMRSLRMICEEQGDV